MGTATDQLALQNIAILRRFFDAINTWDFAEMRRIFHPDISFELPWVIEPFPKKKEGFEATIAFMESVPEFAEAENLYDFTINAFADDPNELVAEYVSDMKLKSGREYTNQYIVRATVKDGKLIMFREYMDAAKLLVAMGGGISMPTAPSDTNH
jgi:ketosteroid isomerase-like protein